MQRANSTVHEEWWSATAEVAWGEAPPGPDVATLRAENDHLRRVMAGRARVDQACGMVMALAPCRRGAARALLVDISRQCDVTLRQVAEALVATTEDEPFPMPMQRALRASLRRMHTTAVRYGKESGGGGRS
ncbi:hypothetical protein GCM10010329_19090 [Streptomyces spiroverticillatus]|uniref:ANTAR domain-containing protein n=1 Tax=Streptomyces finlayi TaxID=67296 RepID=A0A918WUK8_9ACTN|nr:ANTAR domain-containing protein [Streptomyces finlayi]GGZ97930.1 hypothetical protein GCM10010329_19090 [Streptomyces spiroverticillatus]GHC82917.1 hypothetical protein GCM10010334_11570 [Streptomyces finlayi]